MLAEALDLLPDRGDDPDEIAARPSGVESREAHADAASSGSAEPAFRATYEEHFDFVWRFAALRGVPRAALDDVVQEVFLVVHRKLPEFEGRCALRTWIAAITRFTVHGYLRKRGNRVEGLPADVDELYVAQGPGPAEALEHKTASALLQAILSKMSNYQREAFTLCDIEGFSASAAAEALGINESTLRTRLHDARHVFNTASARIAAQQTWDLRKRGGPR